MYPEGVTEPPNTILLLLQPFIGALQKPGIFFIQALPPNAVKDPFLLTE